MYSSMQWLIEYLSVFEGVFVGFVRAVALCFIVRSQHADKHA